MGTLVLDQQNMQPPAGMNNTIDKQTLEEMTRFNPSPDIKNIMVTGGNGFMYIAVYQSVYLRFIAICLFPLVRARRVSKADLDSTEVLGSSEVLLSPIKTITT